MQDFATFVFQSHSAISFTGTAGLLAVFLDATPSFVPVVLVLSTLLIYSQIITRRDHAVSRFIFLWLSLTVGLSIAHMSPSIHALSTTATSVVFLFLASAMTSSIALCAVVLDTRLSMRLPAPWAQITLFPAIWATVWYGVSYYNPVGRLMVLSPVLGMERYHWIVQILGPSGNDWIVAAWAVVISQAVGMWYVGSNEDEGPLRLDGPLIEHLPPDQSELHLSKPSPSRSVVVLGLFLTALTLPSFAINTLPISPYSPNRTPITVGCVLPTYQRYKHSPPTLEDFIAESQKLTSANILLWPEGAVQFESIQERDDTLETIRKKITGPYIGVSFEEPMADGRRGSRQTGLALISNRSMTPHLIYHKRHLVPVAESFSLTHSTAPPTIFELPLTAPSKDWSKTEWAPGPNHTRPIPLTASICLDFSAPSPFADLETRPAIILAPARTWHTAVGVAMWEQAKQRADEVGSMVLWCDGGEGGVSGVAGNGFSEMNQVGEGSWVKTIGLPWPFKETRTIYAREGDVVVMMIFWAILVVGGWSKEFGDRYGRQVGLRFNVGKLTRGMNAVYNNIVHRRKAQNGGARQSTAEVQDLLT